jgi:hypothetical protein
VSEAPTKPRNPNTPTLNAVGSLLFLGTKVLALVTSPAGEVYTNDAGRAYVYPVKRAQP